METTLFWKEFATEKPDGRQSACIIAGFEIIKNISIRSIRPSDWDPRREEFDCENFQVLFWAYFPRTEDVQF